MPKYTWVFSYPGGAEMETTIKVVLLEHTPNPLRSLYVAFRGDYSHVPFHVIWERIEDERISPEQMVAYVKERLEAGHTSPLYQVTFKFSVSGLSRVTTHQLVRHHIGIDFEQQSLRYVQLREGRFPYIIPRSVKEHGKQERFEEAMKSLGELYQELVDEGIPAEDARFSIPMAVGSNIQFNVNVAELLHIADERLCMRTQWEFRHLVAKVRTQVLRVEPLLGRLMQPKCGEHRLMYCNEEFKSWERCPIGKSRPHKSQVKDLIEAAKKGQELPTIQAVEDLRDEDFETIETSTDYLE
jgi:thymidylate synthase (FAD)